MKHTKPIVRAAAAVLLIAGSGQVRALSGDQESACGAILCLAGGAGVAACAPYLARYFAIDAANPTRLFEKRLDFLNLCPASGLPGDVRPMIARYGATCQPTQLVRYLNGQIRSCQVRATDGVDDCEPSGDEWRICAAFYDHGYTVYDPPQLQEQCSRERGDDGYWTERCSYTWVGAGSAAPAAEGSPLSGLAPSSLDRTVN